MIKKVIAIVLILVAAGGLYFFELQSHSKIREYKPLSDDEKGFFEAVYDHNLQKVKMYVSSPHNVNVNAIDEDGYTAVQTIYSRLGIADEQELKEVAKVFNYLIDNGYDIEYTRPNGGGYTMLHNAVMYGLKQTVKKLIDEGADTSRVTEYGDTALFMADSVDMLEFLLKHTDYKITDKSDDNDTLLLDVVGTKVTLPLVEYLVDKLPLEEQDKRGYTALLKVANDKYTMDARVQAIDILLEHGADVKALTPKNSSVLLNALYWGLPFEAIKNIVDYGVDINKSNNFGVSPVHLASQYMQSNVIALLHQKGVNLNLLLSSKKTPLIMAVESKSTNVVEYLVQNKALLNLQDENGKTALNYAVELKLDDIIAILKKAGAKAKSKNEIEKFLDDKKKVEALAQKKKVNSVKNIDDAIRSKNVKEVEKFLKTVKKERLGALAIDACRFATLEIFNLIENKGLDLAYKNKNGSSLLHMAVFYDNVEIAKYLIEKELDINAISKEDRSVYILSSHASIEMYKLLIDAQIKISEKDKNEIVDNALYYNKTELAEYLVKEGLPFNLDKYRKDDAIPVMILRNEVETVKFLVNHGFGVDETFHFMMTDYTILTFAARKVRTDIIKFMIEKGAKWDIPSNHQYGSAVEYILQSGDIEVVKLLVKHGFDLSKKEKTLFYKYPLRVALNEKKHDLVLYMLEQNISIYKNESFPPLYVAAGNGYLDVVKMLVKRGFDPLETTSRGEYPIENAQEGGYKLLVEYLDSFDTIEIFLQKVKAKKATNKDYKRMTLRSKNLKNRELLKVLSQHKNFSDYLWKYMVNQIETGNTKELKYSFELLERYKIKYDKYRVLTFPDDINTFKFLLKLWGTENFLASDELYEVLRTMVLYHKLDMLKLLRQKGVKIKLPDDYVQSLLSIAYDNEDKEMITFLEEDEKSSKDKKDSLEAEGNKVYEWVTPSTKLCKDNGGEEKENGCEVDFKSAQKICHASGAKLPSIEMLMNTVQSCNGLLARGDDSKEKWYYNTNKNKENTTYKVCYENLGFKGVSYYSNSLYNNSTYYYWHTRFSDGDISWNFESVKYFVRCVK